MTAEEAIDQCLGAGISTETNEPVGWLDTDKLREFGYVIIPVTPSGETIEKIARAICGIDPWEAFTEDARAAYTAIIGVEG